MPVPRQKTLFPLFFWNTVGDKKYETNKQGRNHSEGVLATLPGDFRSNISVENTAELTLGIKQRKRDFENYWK